jgi:hypothetical protein
MKLVAVSRVKNEVDIIESFVRHNAGYFDKLIILDDGSTDGTVDVLKSLRAAGLPLVLLQEGAVGYEQSYYMTKLLRLAVSQFGADWVAPLDADEFLELQGLMTLDELLARQEPSLITLAWSNFVWKPEYKESLELNPVLRMRFRLPPRPDMMKVLVPAHLVDENVRLQQGNHGLIRGEEVFPAHPLTSLGICHFPIRNLVQYASKVVVGYLQYSALPRWDRTLGFHFVEPFHTLLADGLDGLERRMAMDSLHYSELSQSSNVAEPTEAPLRYTAGPLTFTSPLQEKFLRNILRHAETIAQEQAAIINRSETRFREHAAMLAISQQVADDKAAVDRRLAELEIELLATREVNFVQRERLSSRSYRFLELVYRRLAALGMRPGLVSNWVFWLLGIK